MRWYTLKVQMDKCTHTLNMNGSYQKCKTFCRLIRRIGSCENFESLDRSPASCKLWMRQWKWPSLRSRTCPSTRWSFLSPSSFDKGLDYATRTVEIVPIVIVWTLKVKVKAVFGIRDADAEEERLIVSFIVPPDQFLDHRMGRNYTIFTHLWPCAVDLRVAETKDKSNVCSSSYYYSE